jgi:hypothetical protein
MRLKFHQCCGALALASAVFFSACSKQETSNPQPANANGQISYEMAAENPNSTISGDAAGIEKLAAITNQPSMAKTTGLFDFTWTEVMLRIREIKFSARKGSDEVNFSAKVDKLVDVLKAIGFIGVIDIPNGTYQHVKVYVKAAGDTANPAAILKGKITWQGADIPFSIRLAGSMTMKADARDVVVSDTSLSMKGKLMLDLKIVTAKLQLGDFTGSFSGGQLVINVNLNTGMGGKIRGGFESCMHAYHRRND